MQLAITLHPLSSRHLYLTVHLIEISYLNHIAYMKLRPGIAGEDEPL